MSRQVKRIQYDSQSERTPAVYMSDVLNLLCVVVRTLPNVIDFSVNLIVPEGLDTPNNMYQNLIVFSCEPYRS